MMNNHLSPDLLVDYLHGELPPEDDALAHAHLAACADCRRAVDLEASLTEALRKQAKADEVELPSLVKAAVWEHIRAARPGPLTRFSAWLRPIVAIPVVAVLLVAGFIASPLGHPGTSAPTVDALYYLQAHAAQTAQTPLSDQAAPPALEISMLSHGTAPLLADVDPSLADASGLDDSR